MSERFKVQSWKGCVGAIPPWVRIPSPLFLKMYTMKVSHKILNRQTAFRGWETNDLLKGKLLNNEKELTALSEETKFDIRTTKCKDNKYLPGHDVYFTVASKKVANLNYYATDCLIIEKDIPQDKLSKSLFQSAEKSVGKLYGKLAQLKVMEDTVENHLVSDSISKKFANLFKKLLQIFRK